MKKTLAILGLSTALALTATINLQAKSNDEQSAAEQGKTLQIAGVRIGNLVDPSTWWDASGKHFHEDTSEVEMFPIDPEFWLSWINPKTHSKMFSAATNPATYKQFLDPANYAKLRDVTIWAKWFNPDTYAVLADPETYTYWLQPGAYTHMLDTKNYAQLVNVDAYGKLFTQGTQFFGYPITPPKGWDILNADAWSDAASKPLLEDTAEKPAS